MHINRPTSTLEVAVRSPRTGTVLCKILISPRGQIRLEMTEWMNPHELSVVLRAMSSINNAMANYENIRDAVDAGIIA